MPPTVGVLNPFELILSLLTTRFWLHYHRWVCTIEQQVIAHGVQNDLIGTIDDHVARVDEVKARP